eukprot:3926549-Rhodomonas_salina.1
MTNPAFLVAFVRRLYLIPPCISASAPARAQCAIMLPVPAHGEIKPLSSTSVYQERGFLFDSAAFLSTCT